jgi:hypothetical protein
MSEQLNSNPVYIAVRLNEPTVFGPSSAIIRSTHVDTTAQSPERGNTLLQEVYDNQLGIVERENNETSEL